MKTIINRFLPFAVIITAFCILAYVTVQQAYRQGANDPQIQMAEDTAYLLDNGAPLENFWMMQGIEMTRSLEPFIVIYNLEGDPVGGSGLFNGGLPEVPLGSLEYARQNGQNRITWKPLAADETRIAAVIVPYKDGYVLAGRNLREVEIREAQTTQFAGMTWVLAMLSTFIVIAFGERFLKLA